MTLFLCSTSDVIKVVTDSTANVDVHASWVDRNGTTDTPGRTNTAISTATTTTVVAAPASSTTRNVRKLIVRNRHATTNATVTIQHYDGSTTIELEKRVLGPGTSLVFDDAFGFLPTTTGGPQARPYFGLVAGAYGDGDPGALIQEVQRGSVVAATPTNITTSIARCCYFRLPFNLTVNTIRYYGVGAPTASLFRVAIYRASDLARLTAELAFSPAANAWGTAGSALALALAKDTLYFIACAVNATGTTAGPACFGNTIAATTGQVQTAPGSLPGNLAPTNALNGYQFQFAVTTGALPDPAASLVAQAAWTGGMPAFWLDNS